MSASVICLLAVTIAENMLRWLVVMSAVLMAAEYVWRSRKVFLDKCAIDNDDDIVESCMINADPDTIPTEFGWIEYLSSEPTMKDMKAEKIVLQEKISGLLDEFKLKFDVELKAEIVIQM